ncbi:MAG TPA: hypothetical protein VM802_10565 [Chitinophaga sp.]|uniref:hypothetical protein n=1 Tax=Chitinophaga sp. TaxID=1869181 RepID=UPI002CDC4F86|nr:hypothetical protein [Chitinophaga sp.]HVI45306.1 hypothetical protein [Chitinophaga sp.]
MRKVLLLICILSTTIYASAQKIFTTDVDNFWIAYDSIGTTTDSLKQLNFLNTLYINKGTPGLKAFMEVKGYTPDKYLRTIRSYPKFWSSVRPRTSIIAGIAKELQPGIRQLMKCYPALKPADIYFTIGALNSSGTTKDNMVLIGAELATGDQTVDLSELPAGYQKGLASYFNSEPAKNMTLLNIHEYVHTQEKGPGYNLLSQCIYEGACDFVTWLAMGKLPALPYVTYGPLHEEELKKEFRNEMFAPSWNKWLYNSASATRVGDLGYYMGYAICNSYYQRATNKKKAVREIIELDYTDSTAVEEFLTGSGYFNPPINKTAIIQHYDSLRPYVTGIAPFNNNDSLVDPATQELRILFSAEMNPAKAAMDLGPGGKEQNPIASRIGFIDNRKSIAYKIHLLPDHIYSIVVTDGFQSADGYPLKPYTITFKTGK